MADRAQSLLWAHGAFCALPRHVASLDVGAVRSSGELVPLGSAEELFMLAEFVDGHEYADDLLRLRAGEASSGDLEGPMRSAITSPGFTACAVRTPGCTYGAFGSCSAMASASSVWRTVIRLMLCS